MTLTIKQSGNTLQGKAEYTSSVDGSLNETFLGTVNERHITLKEQQVIMNTDHYPLWCVKTFSGWVMDDTFTMVNVS